MTKSNKFKFTSKSGEAALHVLDAEDYGPELRKVLRAEQLEKDVFKIERSAFEAICINFNTVRSLTCYLLSKYGEWDQYLELEMPDMLRDSFREDYGVTEMMRKNPRLPLRTPIDRRAVALQKWFDAEEACRMTNLALRTSRIDLTLLRQVRREIRRILGNLTMEDVRTCERSFRFGPGASTSVKGKWVLPSQKVTDNPYSVTSRLKEFVGYYTQCSKSEIVVENHNRLTFVPKTAKVDRVIAIEPHWNIFVQLGIGALIRQRLERFGLACNTQEHNRQACIVAGRRGLATIDLSSASDTIARELVRELMPAEWFHLLSTARTPSTLVSKGQLRVLDKFSSMGNGFTWELETLIFWATARVTMRNSGVEGTCLAYGDDLIVPSEVAPALARNLESLGFSVNMRKSFWQGDFRESCGVDVWRGQDIRPFFFRGTYEDIHSAVIRIANGLRRYAARLGHGITCDRRLLRAYRVCLKGSTRAIKTCIPDGYGDAGLVQSWDYAAKHVTAAGGSRRRRGWEGFKCPTYERRPMISPYTCNWGALQNWLLQRRYSRDAMELPPDGEPISLSEEYARGVTSAPRAGHLIVPRWTDTPPWERRKK